MGKMLCRIKKGNNTKTLKALIYNDICFHSYIVGNETMEKASEIVLVTSSFEDGSNTQNSKHKSFLSKH